jgi:diguanylate cyclase (GGDEF)-like protein
MLAKSGKRMNVERNFECEVEAARQFALDRYDVLDTGEETCFDHITQAVKLALDVPMAAISFMDGKRLWFKSKVGFDASEMPRNAAFCDFTIHQNGALIIEDTTLDPRFKNNPSVSGEPSLRSYIGVPLTTPDGHNIGTLSALDIVPRKFRHPKIEMMEQLAELVMHELELRQQADTDVLTGALTRSGFSVKVQNAISLYDRQKIGSTLILFNVDRYMMFIDRSDGPSSGKLMKAIIHSLINRLRPTDCVGRIGGSQFAVLLTGTAGPEAREVTEEFLQSIDGMTSGAILDLKLSEITSEIGICDDWLNQASQHPFCKTRSGRGETSSDSDQRAGLAF